MFGCARGLAACFLVHFPIPARSVFTLSLSSVQSIQWSECVNDEKIFVRCGLQ